VPGRHAQVQADDFAMVRPMLLALCRRQAAFSCWSGGIRPNP
jgi:hypothetical protein